MSVPLWKDEGKFEHPESKTRDMKALLQEPFLKMVEPRPFSLEAKPRLKPKKKRKLQTIRGGPAKRDYEERSVELSLEIFPLLIRCQATESDQSLYVQRKHYKRGNTILAKTTGLTKNQSQVRTVETAFENKVSLIWDPTATGKSQSLA